MSAGHWRRRDIVRLFERLEMYLSAGLPIGAALEACAGAHRHRMAEDIGMIRRQVESGMTLSRAFKLSVGASGTAIGLIENGESSGHLTEAMSAARQLMERQQELSGKCLSALAYPAVIGIFAAGITIGLVRGVMPQITPMLLGLHVRLPLLTRAVIAISGYAMKYGLYSLIGMLCASIGGGYAYKKAEIFRRFCHQVIGYVPLIGGLVRTFAFSTFLRSCGSLVESGLPAETAYASAAGIVPFLPLGRALEARSSGVARGDKLSDAVSRCGAPVAVSTLLSAGEMSGSLGSSAVRAADILDKDLDQSLKRLTSLVEPLLMIVMGGAVGAIALSIMMPIYDISKVLQR